MNEPNGNEPQLSPQQQLGISLGLGPNWVPGPVNWQWAEVRAADGSPVHVCVLATVTGTVGVMFDPAGLDRFIAQATERRHGIRIARADEVPG